MNKRILSSVLLIFLSTTLFAQQTKSPKANNPKNTKGKTTAAPAPIHTVGPKVKMEKDTMVDIFTNYGNMRVRLYKETPLHRSNFIKLAQSGFYDSLLFHRIIKDFMIQGGDPDSKNADSTAFLGGGDIGYKIPAEFVKKLYHKKGALAAARDNNPEKASSGCQFYIVQGKKFTAEELSKIVNNMNYQGKMALLQEYMQRDSIKVKLDDYNMRGDQDGLNKYMNQVKAQIDGQFDSKMYMPTQEMIIQYMRFGGTPHLDGNYTVFGELVSGFDVLEKIAEVKTNPAARPFSNVRMSMKIVIE